MDVKKQEKKEKKKKRKKKKEEKKKKPHEICVLKGTKFWLKIPILCQHENCM